MRNRIVGLLLLAVVVVAVRTEAAEPAQIRVLTYNIHHCEGVDRKLDVERIAKVILSMSPDIVALQEVDRNTRRAEKVDQPAELARLTNMAVVFEQNIPFEGGEFGNAILSKFLIASHRNTHLPCFDDGEQRGVLLTELTPKAGGPPIHFYCTHLDYRRDPKERLASAEVINKMALQHPGTPALLAGDLNDTPDSDVLKLFRQQWTLANEKEQPTIPVDKPRRQIDFILFRPADGWKVIEARVLDEQVASDHRPFFAVLER